MSDEKIGLVFAGGGAKGAYQIGVWKAMREIGLDRIITGVSGTSIGAINAVLFSGVDFDVAENVWLAAREDDFLAQHPQPQGRALPSADGEPVLRLSDEAAAVVNAAAADEAAEAASADATVGEPASGNEAATDEAAPSGGPGAGDADSSKASNPENGRQRASAREGVTVESLRQAADAMGGRLVDAFANAVHTVIDTATGAPRGDSRFGSNRRDASQRRTADKEDRSRELSNNRSAEMGGDTAVQSVQDEGPMPFGLEGDRLDSVTDRLSKAVIDSVPVVKVPQAAARVSTSAKDRYQRTLLEGLYNSTKLRELMEKTYPADLHLTTDAFATVYDLDEGRPVYVRLDPDDRDGIIEASLASACMPGVYPPMQLGDRLVCDGGVGDNRPIRPLYDLGYRKFIMLDLNCVSNQWTQNDIDHDHREFPDATFVYIVPGDEFDDSFVTGTLTVNEKANRSRIDQGYREARRQFSILRLFPELGFVR